MKRILEKFAGELSEGLRDTPFEVRDVSVRVTRRKKAKQAAAEEKKPLGAIDFRI